MELDGCYGESWAVVIGINAYAQVPKLSYAIEDAEAIAATLEDTGFPAANISTLTDTQATRQNIMDLIAGDLPRKMGPNDRLVLFFAGHGQDFDAPGGDKLGYIIPVDGDPNYLASRCISMEEVNTWNRLLPAKHILYAMDCCYGGLMASRRQGLDQHHPEYLQELSRRRVRQIITAGGPDEQVIEEGGRGLFSRVFEQALRGEADLMGRGYVTGADLGAFIPETVYSRSRQRQMPLSRYFEGTGEILFQSAQRELNVGGGPGINRGESHQGGGQATCLLEGSMPEPKQPTAEIDRKMADQINRLQQQLAQERQKREQLERKKEQKSAAKQAQKAQQQREKKRTEEREKLQQQTEAENSIDPTTGMEFITIPGGKFMMGGDESDYEKPQHEVTIKPFKLGKHAVTQGQWEKVMGENPSHFTGKGWFRNRDMNNHPVEQVSWDDVQIFIKKLNQQSGKQYRLPSEAEWEYAARAGTTGHYSFSGKISPEKANYNGSYTFDGSEKGEHRDKTVAVGSLPANPWGLYEVHGNVWEWVADCWHDSYKGAPTDGTVWGDANGGDCGQRVLRGGSLDSVPEGVAFCQSARVRPYHPASAALVFVFAPGSFNPL